MSIKKQINFWQEKKAFFYSNAKNVDSFHLRDIYFFKQPKYLKFRFFLLIWRLINDFLIIQSTYI